MAQVTMDDPWHWDTERVVAELCSGNRSWESPSGPLKFPPLDELEARLRKEEVDGHTLLTLDHSELCQELNFTTLKQKATLKYAIDIFRSRSRGFRHHMRRFTASYESDYSKFGDPAPSTSSEDANPFEKRLQHTPTYSLHQIPDTPQPLVTYDPIPEGSVSKRRRIIPTLISSDTNNTLPRNIPTEADGISIIRTGKTSATDSQPNDNVIASPWVYLGEDALTRIDVLGNHLSSEEDVQQMEDQIDFSYRREIPYGRRLQVHQLMKHHTLRIQKRSEFRGIRADLVPGANDPDHDELLPLYGDSDEEYDSETWDEIEAEKNEQEEMDNQPGLNSDEVKSILDESIQQFISDWKERKLSKLPLKANKIWSHARRTGLRRSILNVRSEHDACDARINRFCKEIIAQKYYDVAEVKEQALILQQSVEDRENYSWELSVINAPVEPEKFQSQSRNSTKRSRVLKPTATNEEVLTSESEEYIDDDFIIDDEPTHPSPISDLSPMDIDRDDNMSQGQLDAEEYHHNAGSINQDQRDMIDLTQLEDDVSMSQPGTPEKSREQQVVDLTTPKKIRIKKRSNPSAANGNSDVQEAQPSTLFFNVDDLEPAEQLVAKELAKLDQSYLNEVFTLVIDTRSESDWLYVMNDALDHQDFPRPPHNSQKRKTLAVYTLLRLFEIYRDGEPLSVGRYKKLTYNDILEKMAAWSGGGNISDKINSYVDFLYRLADRFEWKRCSMPAESETPPVKLRRRKKLPRNVDAENLREADKERTAEQNYRRQVLRKKLKSHEYSGLENLDTQKIIINESKGDHDGFIYIHPEIAHRIKEHQVAGVRFMWNQIVDSATKQGCLLAHTMGLGKTMQIITLLIAISEAAQSDDPTISSQIPEGLKESKTLILCPPSLINNWMDEFLFWAPEGHKLGEFFMVDQSATRRQRTANIIAWNDRGGILIIGYYLFKHIHIAGDEEVLEILCDYPNLVVADEAHEMKNPKSMTHIATRNFKSHSRIALTGSPLANNVDEYHAMINWVAPNYLSDLREFRSEYSIPIGRGLGHEATAYERRHAVKMLNALKQEVGPKVQRTTTAVLKHDIPIKQEFILVVPLTPLQLEAYEAFVRFHQENKTADHASLTLGSGGTLGVLCAHPVILLRKLQRAKMDSERNHISKNTLPNELISKEIALINKTPDVNDYYLSWKIPILLSILEECRRLGDAVLIFSQSLATLDYLEHIIRSRKFSSVRLDGSVPTSMRQNTVKDFSKGAIDIFLISTKAGGIGLNMTAANRIILFDSRFNPQNELQAVGRAYRIGQKKQVYVYRLVCGGTLEESSFNMAIRKLQLTSRVVDEKKPIPKAGSSNSSLQMPGEPVQHDYSEQIGKDAVLDSVIEQHKSGIRAIVTMDIFEEEEHEEAALTAEECAEVNQMIERNERRRLGQKTITQASGVVPTRFEGDMKNPEVFMSYLAAQLMPQNWTEETRREHEGIARSITETIVSRQLHPTEQELMFTTISKAANDVQFKFALCSRCIPATQLGNMTVADIHKIHDFWTGMPWQKCLETSKRLKEGDEQLAADRQSGADPKHLQYAIQKMLSTSQAQDSGSKPQKPQRLDDRKALEAVIERRNAKKPSKGKDPRLPNWAINAVTKQQRSASSPTFTAPSTSASASSHISSKSPFK